MSTEKQLYQYGDFSYSMNEYREIIIRHYNGSDSCPLIPTEINGMPVTVLGKNSFFASLSAQKAFRMEGFLISYSCSSSSPS